MNVIAQRYIIYQGRAYQAGDVIHNPDAEMLKAWKASGAVVVINGTEKQEKAKAVAKTAPAPPGKVLEGTGAEGKMVGIPGKGAAAGKKAT